MAWRRIQAWVWLAVPLLAVLFLVWRFSHSDPLETDLLALLPATERNAQAEAAVRQMATALGNRAVLFVGHRDPAQARAAAGQLAQDLQAEQVFRRVVLEVPMPDLAALIEFLRPYRAGLMTEADAALLKSGRFAAEGVLMQRLAQPFPIGMSTPLALDPFGLWQHWLAHLPLTRSRLLPDQGMLTARGEDGLTYVLVSAELLGSAFDSAQQSRAVAAVDRAEAGLVQHFRDARLLRTGNLFFGAAARAEAQREMDLIGGGSVLGVAVLLWWLFRSVRPLLLSMATVAIGTVCAAAMVLLVHGRLHLLTLVFGASLIGEAVDYAIQYFAAHLDAGSKWQAWSGRDRVLPGLGVALATSLIGYGALTLAPFPAISQITLFAFTGLLAAWLSVVLLLPHLVPKAAEGDVAGRVKLAHAFLAYWRRHASQRLVLGLTAAVLLISLPGWRLLTAQDDIRLLIHRAPDLVAQETEIRRLAGMTGVGRFLLVEADDPETLLQREEAVTAVLRAHLGTGLTGFSAVSDFVPSGKRQREHRELLRRHLAPAELAPVLARAGFTDAVAADWAQGLGDGPVLTLADWRATPWAVPFQAQLLPDTKGGAAALILSLQGDDGSLDLARLVSGLPGVSVVDKAASVSATFAHYRLLALVWLPVALGLVLLVLVLRYGLRRGPVLALPTALAMGLALALQGWLGQALTLFSVMGLVLVLGVGVNYAIFLVEAGDRAPAPFAGVLLSAATTTLSFGLLSFSSMPALHQFGLILLPGIFFSVLLAPMALPVGKASCP